MHYTLRDPFYYYDDEYNFPIKKEKLGICIGPTQHCGHSLISWILTENQTFLARSILSPAYGHITINHRRRSLFCDEVERVKVNKNPDYNYINTKAGYILTSGQEITQYDDLPSFDPMDLLGYIFVWKHDGTVQCSEVKQFLEKDKNYMVQNVNGDEELMNYNYLTKIFKSLNGLSAKNVTTY